MTDILSIEIPVTPELKEAVEQISALSGQPPTEIAQQALRHYVGWRGAQLADLQKGIAAADQGEFASEDEVNAVFTRYGA
ncbi:CopG family transcriptional regulator [Duganella sp. FT109W]|uniref:CopG family transcriptional regulator n=1 Tax=Duganella margarita TaxID=2692170 RepID=A0ABW9WN24_9BURK|nr:CopG family transcriptional regulator [Duganella margarita]MYN42622.1 CopG family transcriptional regulator [Duganella margarita]